MAKGNFKRVAKKYHWDYQAAELALADGLATLSGLKQTVDRLSADIDALLAQPETPFDLRQQFSADFQSTLHRLVHTLNGQLGEYRRAYFAQSGQVVALRQQLMLAKVRRDKSRERLQMAIADEYKARLDNEMLEIADRLNARKIARPSIDSITTKRADNNRHSQMEAQSYGY